MAVTNLPNNFEALLLEMSKALWGALFYQAQYLKPGASTVARKTANSAFQRRVFDLQSLGQRLPSNSDAFYAAYFYKLGAPVYTSGFSQVTELSPEEKTANRWLSELATHPDYNKIRQAYIGSAGTSSIDLNPPLTQSGSIETLIRLNYYKHTQELGSKTHQSSKVNLAKIFKSPNQFGYLENDRTNAFFSFIEAQTVLWATNHKTGLFGSEAYPNYAGSTINSDVLAIVKKDKIYKEYVAAGDASASKPASADERVLAQVNKELDASTIKGLQQGLADIDHYSKQKSVSASAKAELAKLKPQFESKIKDLEASAAQAKSNPAANKGANPVNPSGKAAGKVKDAVEKRNEEEGVTKYDTTANPVTTQSPEAKINANLQVVAPEPEELTADASTIDLILADPIGAKTSEPFYRTQLFNTDLNDFRRVQLVLPNGLNQDPGAQNPISFFKLQNSPTSARATTTDEGLIPSYDNPIPGGFQYNQFFLKGVDETRNEKFQLVDTPAQGQTLFGFGEKPEFWTIRGQVINDSLNDWATKLRLAWDKKIRISQLIENGQFLEITIPAIRIVLGCYPVALTISHSDDSETLPSFAMVVFKRHESVVPEVRYRRDSAAIAMVNSILSLDKKNLLLATESNALRPTFDGTADQAATPTAGAEPIPVVTGA